MIIIEYIFASIFGIMLGSYATCIYYRLPREIALNAIFDNGLPPSCGSCNHNLKFYEYYPPLSWFSTLGKCNYCGIKLDIKFILIEILGIVFSLICYQKFYFSNLYIFNILFLINLAVILMIRLDRQKIPNLLFLVGFFLGIIISVLFVRNELDWIMPLGINLSIALTLFKIKKFKLNNDLFYLNVLLSSAVPVSTFLPNNLFMLLLKDNNKRFYFLIIATMVGYLISN